MQPARTKSISLLMALVLSICSSVPAQTLKPEVLFNFQLSIGTITDTLVQGPDGNFYGTTTQGGPTGNGTVFRVTPAGVLTTLASDQANPAPGLVVGNDGLLYGMNETGGGFSGFGSVFKMTTGGVLTNFAIFDGVNGGNPQGGPVLAGDGNFYGTSQEGGTNSIGAVFRVTPGGVVTPLVSFDGSTLGGFPVTGLTLGPDGNLYGTTSIGGTAGRGTIFKVTLAGNLTTLHSFQGAADGFTRSARLTLGPDGNLYGTSRDGGGNDLGVIYRISPAGVYTNLVSFAGTNGISPWAELTVGADNQLYGTTQLGGSASEGTVFKTTTNGTLTTLASFPDQAHGGPKAGLLLASDGNFYGCSAGDIFRMTPGGVLTSLVSLLPLTGNHPQGALVIGPDGNFYGTTRDGGSNSVGTIFKITADGNLTSLFSFSSTNGSAPEAGLAVGRDGNFYGTTALGGSANSGTAFRLLTNGALTSLVSFGGTNGANPQCQLVMDATGNFYGNAANAGANFAGTIFHLTTNGALTTLASFDGTNFAFPDDDALAIGPDGNIYGTTANGGTGHFGTVFKMTPAGALTRLFSFSNTNGQAPIGGLLLANDGNLYGSAAFGGAAAFGTLFKMTTNGALTTLHDFQFSDGEEPSTRLIQGSDGSLYGTAQSGGFTGGNSGSSGLGTVFRITTNGAFTLLTQFQGTNGSNPSSSLLLGPDGNLYGVTANGGSGNGGTIFRIVLTPHLAGIARLPDGSMLITGTGPSSNSFRVWASSDLSKPIASWTQLTNGVFAADGTFSFTDAPAVATPVRFYRVSTP